MLKAQTCWAAAFFLMLTIGGCAGPNLGIDPKLAAEVDYIKIAEKAPEGKCRYLGETVSFRRLLPENSVDVFNVDGSIRAKQDLALREHAKQLGANMIHVHLSYNTGLLNLVQVHTYHAC